VIDCTVMSADTFQPEAGVDDLAAEMALSLFEDDFWMQLSPAERLRRAWALRARLRDPYDAHDQKLFPAP
jgi:hypothetical protein